MAVDPVRPAADIAAALVDLVSRPRPAAGTRLDGAELPDWVAIENRMFDKGGGTEDLDQTGSRVPLTCPECGGALWEIGHADPLRHRCHTGHAFTAWLLATMQSGKADEALWAAARALHAQERLYRDMHRKLETAGASDTLDKAEQAAAHAQVLRGMIASSLRHAWA